MLSDEPSVSTELLWTLRVCPEGGEEVYETRVVRLNLLTPEEEERR